jgi:hypothetical protein
MEKQWKQKTVKAVLIIAGLLTIGFFTIGCKNDPDNSCKCPNGTEHDAPCPCGGGDCVCTVKQPVLHGTISGTSIQVFKDPGVTDAQMATAFSNLESAYNNPLMTGAKQIKVKDNIKEIHITNVGGMPTHTVDGSGKYTISVKYDVDMLDFFTYYANSVFVP